MTGKADRQRELDPQDRAADRGLFGVPRTTVYTHLKGRRPMRRSGMMARMAEPEVPLDPETRLQLYPANGHEEKLH